MDGIVWLEMAERWCLGGMPGGERWQGQMGSEVMGWWGGLLVRTKETGEEDHQEDVGNEVEMGAMEGVKQNKTTKLDKD